MARWWPRPVQGRLAHRSAEGCRAVAEGHPQARERSRHRGGREHPKTRRWQRKPPDQHRGADHQPGPKREAKGAGFGSEWDTSHVADATPTEPEIIKARLSRDPSSLRWYRTPRNATRNLTGRRRRPSEKGVTAQ